MLIDDELGDLDYWPWGKLFFEMQAYYQLSNRTLLLAIFSIISFIACPSFPRHGGQI